MNSDLFLLSLKKCIKVRSQCTGPTDSGINPMIGFSISLIQPDISQSYSELFVGSII